MPPESSSATKPLPNIFFIMAGVLVLTFLLDYFSASDEAPSTSLRIMSLLIDIGMTVGLIGLRVSYADSFRFSHADGSRNNAVFWSALVIGIAALVMHLIGRM